MRSVRSDLPPHLHSSRSLLVLEAHCPDVDLNPPGGGRASPAHRCCVLSVQKHERCHSGGRLAGDLIRPVHEELPQLTGVARSFHRLIANACERRA
jgi:hypothetical protein